MSQLNIRRLILGAIAATSLACAAPCFAQGTPLRVILPVGPGSGVDVIVRSAQNALSKALGGQPVVIENQPGAGGISGTQNLVRATPDGNTIAIVSNNHSVNPSVFKKMPYDGLADITPISVIGGSPFVLVVNPGKVPAKNAKELQAFLKAKPDGYNYGSSGTGTIIHLAGELFVDAAGVQVKHIPYKAMGALLTDIIGGQVEMGASAVSAALGQIKGGALRPIGIMGKQRVTSLPDVPTMAEQGLPDVDISGWFAAIGPKGLPPAQVKRLQEALVAAFNDPEVKAGFAKRDDFLILSTPEAAGQFLKTEQARYARLVQKAGIQPE